MNILRSFIIAFAMYSKVPMPKVQWTKQSMQYTFCFFPLIGFVTGGILLAVGWPLLGGRDAGRIPAVFPACVLTILPLLVTGGIHMDGFMDTSDARHSYQEKGKKLEILKDPHTGAFAVMSLGIYLLWNVAVWSVAGREVLLDFFFAGVVTRVLSGYSVTAGKGAKKDGLAASFRNSAKGKAVTVTSVCYLIILFLVMTVTRGIKKSALLFGTAFLVFFYYLFMARKEFGGITGDLAGYFLQVCELSVLTVLTVSEWI